MPRRTIWVFFLLLATSGVGLSLHADDASPAPSPAPLSAEPSGDLASFTTGTSQSLASDNPPTHCADQIVLASTRNYPNVSGRLIDLDTFVGYRCYANGTCSNETIDLTQCGDFVETWIFVHGNQIPANLAVERGARVYRQLRCRSAKRGPIRFIIYSWPSERETCRLADTETKVRRTNAESFYFASFLSAICDQSPLNIIAYSFGARITCGGLHLLNGGSLDGYCYPNPTQPMCSMRITMLAAAVESDGILPGGRYARAMRACDKLLLMNNSRDQALRFFWFIDRSRPRALGRVGLKNSPYGCSVLQYDWQKTFGKDHSIWNYFDRPMVIDRILQTFAR